MEILLVINMNNSKKRQEMSMVTGKWFKNMGKKM